MATLTEGQHTAEFLVSEANGLRSRETGTLISGQNCVAGTVLAVITASGKYTARVTGGAGGAAVAKAVLYDNVDASAGDKTGVVVIARDAEVNASELVWPDETEGEIAAGVIELAAVGIIAR